MSELKAIVESIAADAEQHGVKGQKWGVRRPVTASGLVARTSSADQIHQDRVASKLASGGSKTLSNKDIQDYVRRLDLQKQLSKAQAEAAPAKTKSFIRTFVAQHGSKQLDRVANKAIDVAMEKAVEHLGLSAGKKGHNPDLADLLVKTSARMAPKKK